VSNAGAVTVTARDGRVTLQGPVLERELDDLLRAVRKVPGVRDVVNELEVHPGADKVPALQDGASRN
jgi:osmotically-inducible protein OsmY